MGLRPKPRPCRGDPAGTDRGVRTTATRLDTDGGLVPESRSLSEELCMPARLRERRGGAGFVVPAKSDGGGGVGAVGGAG